MYNNVNKIHLYHISKVLTSTVRRTEDVEGEQHGVGEGGGLLLTGKVQPIDLAGVTPLMEGRGGLVVLQALDDGVVDHNLPWGRRKRSCAFKKAGPSLAKWLAVFHEDRSTDQKTNASTQI